MKKDYIEIELKDVFHVVWKRKWLILFLTLFYMAAAVIVSFLLPPQWTVTALIEPSKYLVWTGDGKFKEILYDNPKNIVAKISQGAYTNLIASELALDPGRFSRLNVENPSKTNLIHISLKTKDVDEAVDILNSLYNHLKLDIDKTAQMEVSSIEFQIMAKEIDILMIEKEKKTCENKLAIIKKRAHEIEKESAAAKTRIQSFEDEQKKNLKNTSRSVVESMSWLLYSNEIQQNMKYHDSLKELLGQKKIQEENIRLEIGKKIEQIKKIRNNINYLNNKKGWIDFSTFLKEPTSSVNPVSPRKKLNAVIGGILGFIFSLLFVFIIESIKKTKLGSEISK